MNMFHVVGLSRYIQLHPSAHWLNVPSASRGFAELSGVDTGTDPVKEHRRFCALMVKENGLTERQE